MLKIYRRNNRGPIFLVCGLCVLYPQAKKHLKLTRISNQVYRQDDSSFHDIDLSGGVVWSRIAKSIINSRESGTLCAPLGHQ